MKVPVFSESLIRNNCNRDYFNMSNRFLRSECKVSISVTRMANVVLFHNAMFLLCLNVSFIHVTICVRIGTSHWTLHKDMSLFLFHSHKNISSISWCLIQTLRPTYADSKEFNCFSIANSLVISIPTLSFA